MLLRTWLKYSSAIRLAHSTQYFNGRVGFDTSAHLIIILFTSITFSGSIAADRSKSWEPCTQIFRENVYKDSSKDDFVIDLFKEKKKKPRQFGEFGENYLITNIGENVKVIVTSIYISGILVLKAFINLARCSKCFVISVARIMSITLWRTCL